GTAASFGTFTYASEDANAAKSTALLGAEVFPEPRTEGDPAYDPALSVHRFNHFFPWEINQDGTAEETLNHIGRHELGGSYTDGSFKNDPNLSYYVSPSLHANQLQIAGSAGLFHFREDPANLGEFVTTYAGEFGTASGGTLMRLTAAPGLNADSMVLTALTPTDQDLVPEQTGYFRNPLPMSDGTLIAVHTPATGQITNLGTVNSPNWSYDYRLKKLSLQGEYYVPIANLTAGIAKNVSQWTPDELATYGGPMWELYPVEVMPRPVPVARTSVLPSVEAGVFAAEGVDPEQFREFLRDNGLALIVSRNVTQRDRADKQQPFNLQVPGGVSSIAKSGQVYQVAHMQIFQADALRGKGGAANPQPGRRLLARPMHQPGVSQSPSSPEGGVMIAADGSVAALVPAQRALTWQLTDSNGTGIVRERNWISFQAGEIRVCTSCHGINTLSQTGHPEPTNPPQALHDLLVSWKLENGAADTPTPAPTDTPQNTPTATATATASASATATDTATETVTPTSTETETPVPSETDTLPAQTPVPTEEPPTVGTCESGLTLRNHRLHAIGGMSRLMLRAALVLPKPWQEVDPASFGIRLTVPGMFDVEVPGGEGWSTAANGARWSYSNPDGAGGVKRIDVLDRSQREDGLLMVVMKMAEGFVMVAPQPLELTIRLGDAGECAVGQWHGPAGAKPRCRGRGGKLACR
ncbi:MAG TPA: hypothetical protein VEB21_04845, partial [Terriglobales bacterium]|nr:hypothetical protein [Terriglobales bacterium]